MRKFAILTMAIILVAAFTLPAAALENTFGGYWRTRFYTQADFSGNDDETQDLSQVDTRTRLYYTAKLNDNLKLVNKFEIDAVWGDTNWGDIGADGVNVQVKNSYAEFNMADFTFKVGVQGITINRGFIFADDAAGLVARYAGGSFDINLLWIKAYEGGIGVNGNAEDNNDADVDAYVLYPNIKITENVSFSPMLAYITTSRLSDWSAARGLGTAAGVVLNNVDETDIYDIGFDLDMSFDPVSIWATFVYQTGTLEDATTPGTDYDLTGYLAAIGGTYVMGPLDIHGQIFYATGDDTVDEDIDSFYQIPGRSYYWSEIMGFGIFDNQVSNRAPSDEITNIMAYNLGAGFKATDKLKLALDLWYASLAEDVNNNSADATEGNDELGFEVDLKLTYQLVDGLNLDVVAAYLFAGDAVVPDKATGTDENPYELGAQLSLSF